MAHFAGVLKAHGGVVDAILRDSIHGDTVRAVTVERGLIRSELFQCDFLIHFCTSPFPKVIYELYFMESRISRMTTRSSNGYFLPSIS